MRALILACLLVLPTLAAEGMHVQLRYQPAPQTRWVTEGRLVTQTTVSDKTSTDEQVVKWEDTVTSRDLAGDLAIARSWPEGQLRLTVSKLGEQKLPTPSLLEQPAIFPVPNVEVGDTWTIEHTARGRLGIESGVLEIQSVTRGTGKLVSLEDGVANLELALAIDSQGSNARAASTSHSDVTWTLKVDRSTGVALQQRTVTRTVQTVTLPGNVVIPSRTESVLELTTRPG